MPPVPDERQETFSAVDQRQTAAPSTPRPRLVLALRCADPLARSEARSLDDLDEMVIGRGSEVTLVGRRLVWKLADSWMSTEHATLRRGPGRWIIEDAGSKNGTLVNGAKVDQAELMDSDVIELGQTFFVYRDAPAPVASPTEPQAPLPGLATHSPTWAADLEALARVAPTRVNVVLLGESGTGKEVVARAIHEASGRSGSFVAVNCGALPTALVEATLFGHKRGAFSGAVDNAVGLVRSADGGTLLLDEIGDLPAAAQAAFLRVLQEREVLAIGASRPVKVDVRVISATHRDLERLAASGHFRADLLARLNGLVLNVPPLRARREDLGILIGALVRRSESQPTMLSFTAAAARALFLYHWPLNVRELEKVLETAIALAGRKTVEPSHLAAAVRQAPAGATRRGPVSAEAEAERARLVALFLEHGGNVSAVARALGTTRMTVHRLARRHGLDLRAFRPAP
jgi:transcriptional regulator with GAF, ATPase, and Fis domain